MARNLNLRHVRRVPKRRDVVMLQYPIRVKEVHKRLSLLPGVARFLGNAVPDYGVCEVGVCVEVFVDIVGFCCIVGVLGEGVPVVVEAMPHFLGQY